MINDTVEWAITLGTKEEYREKFTRDKIKKRVENIFTTLGYIHLVYSVERYNKNGLHVHIYYMGKPIRWITFNKLWGLGYVKNRPIYNLEGWLRYVKKEGDAVEWGEGIMFKTPMERFTGKLLSTAVKETEQILEIEDDEINWAGIGGEGMYEKNIFEDKNF